MLHVTWIHSVYIPYTNSTHTHVFLCRYVFIMLQYLQIVCTQFVLYNELSIYYTNKYRIIPGPFPKCTERNVKISLSLRKRMARQIEIKVIYRTQTKLNRSIIVEYEFKTGDITPWVSKLYFKLFQSTNLSTYRSSTSTCEMWNKNSH